MLMSDPEFKTEMKTRGSHESLTIVIFFSFGSAKLKEMVIILK